LNDQQIMTLVIGLAIPIGAMIYSNARISDAKEVMLARMDASFERLSNQIRELKDAVHIHEVEHHHK
jgi:hypothetical protein